MNPNNPTDNPGDTALADEEMLDILRRVQSGELSVEEAERLLSAAPAGGEEPAPAGATFDSQSFAAPLGKTANGRLVFERGTASLILRAEELPGQLFTASFSEHHRPVVRVNGGTVTVRYRDFGRGWLNWLRSGFNAPSQSSMTLNAAIPWQIDMSGGLVQSQLDLRSLKLRGLGFRGGVVDVEIQLGEPAGVVPLDISGGGHNITILRPASVPVRLTAEGGAVNLALDSQKLGAVGGSTTLETPQFAEAASYYVITFTGGVNNLKVAS